MTKKARPQKFLIYGPQGVGKTTLCASMRQQGKPPFIVDLEGGAYFIEKSRYKEYDSLTEIEGDLHHAISKKPDDIGYFVFDTLDELQRLMEERVCESHDKKSMGDFTFGRGDKFLASAMRDFQSLLSQLLRAGYGIVLIAHERHEKVQPPDGESYQRYAPSLNGSVTAVFTQWCDHVFFLTMDRHTLRHDEGFNNKRTLAKSSGERIIYTESRPAWLAKSRAKLPLQMPAEWPAIEALLEPKTGESDE